MRKITTSAWLAAGALASCLAWAAPARATAYSALYSFGDSLSDVGNAFIATSGAEPASPYFNGRFSNGPLWNEDLSARLGLGAVTPSLAGGNDYAVGGAQTGVTAVNPTAQAGDLPSQLVAFQAAHATAPSTALYTVWAGANDLSAALATGSPTTAATVAAQAAANVAATVKSLIQDGARTVLVADVPDLGKTPALLALGPTTAAAGTALSQLFDTTLYSDLAGVWASTGVDPRFFDTFSLLDAAVASPSAYGFTNVTSACWTGTYFGTGGTTCASPGTSLFWDHLHPTAAADVIVGGAAALLVPEPASLALLAAGVLGLAGMRRRNA